MAITLLSLMMLISGPPAGADAAPASASGHEVERCLVVVIDEAEVPAREAGVIAEISAGPGDQVQAGQAIARLDSDDARARVEVAGSEFKLSEYESNSRAKVEVAAAEAEVTESEFLQGADLPPSRREGELSEQRLRRLLLAPRRAGLATASAELDHQLLALKTKVKGALLAEAKLALQHRGIVAPLDGEIVEVHKHAGEWVSPGEPVMRIVRMEKLRVEGYVPASDFAPQEIIRAKATATIYLARGREVKLPCQITHASAVIETSGQYRIWAEIENRKENGQWMLQPGLSATLKLHLKQ